MSTYNGAAYIAEQLDSIITQSVQDWQLAVRDDGSTDNTCEILRAYAEKDTRIHIVEDHERRGSMRAYEWLLEHYGDGEYIAFADQDDVWLPDKLQVCQEKMRQSERQYGDDMPIVVHTDLVVVDGKLHIVAKSFWHYAFIKPDVLNRKVQYLAICNSVTGCTILMNKSAKKVALPFGAKALMHDAAVAVNVKKCGGKIMPIFQSTMLYRQHGHNTLGAVKYHLWRSFSARYTDAKEHYQTYHPEIFANVLSFIYWKIRCFCAEHL